MESNYSLLTMKEEGPRGLELPSELVCIFILEALAPGAASGASEGNQLPLQMGKTYISQPVFPEVSFALIFFGS